MGLREVVITGVGVVSPIGVGVDAFWASLCEGRSGVRVLADFNGAGVPSPIGGVVADFNAAQWIRPRKAIKVMSRDIQMGFVAADLACTQAALETGQVAPDRFGVSFGADLIACELDEMVDAYRSCMVDGQFDFSLWGTKALGNMYPLWMLKYLPNMPGCQIAIAHDARGPNNSQTLAEVSGLSSMIEATHVIQRGQADAMIVGSVSSRNHPTVWARRNAYEMSQRIDDPAAACRPFDADRDGMVHGEGAAAFLLESREHAQARHAKIYARVLGGASAFEPHAAGQPLTGQAIRQSIAGSLREAGLQPADLGHVNANGMGTRHEDRIEAQAIRELLGDVPVTAPKSFFGNLSAGAGSVEAAVSVLAFQKGVIPPTLNYRHPDPECPVHVIHDQPVAVARPVAMLLNQTRTGHAVALVIAGEE